MIAPKFFVSSSNCICACLRLPISLGLAVGIASAMLFFGASALKAQEPGAPQMAPSAAQALASQPLKSEKNEASGVRAEEPVRDARGVPHYHCDVLVIGAGAAGLAAAGAALGAAGFTTGTLPSTVISLRGHFCAQMPQPMHFS